MKLIRLTDERYVLDAGPELRAADMEMIREYWKDWWEKHPGEIPEVIVFGGSREPLIYEDRRDADIERRVAALEAHVHAVARHDESGVTLFSGKPEGDPLA